MIGFTQCLSRSFTRSHPKNGIFFVQKPLFKHPKRNAMNIIVRVTFLPMQGKPKPVTALSVGCFETALMAGKGHSVPPCHSGQLQSLGQQYRQELSVYVVVSFSAMLSGRRSHLINIHANMFAQIFRRASPGDMSPPLGRRLLTFATPNQPEACCL